MRTLIVNANIVTGDGKTILENRSIIIEGELIESIRTDPCPIYDPASRAVDAKGGWVIPGLIDHHTHMITRGPYPADYALPGLPKARVMDYLNTHLLEGTTTIVNQDGFNTMDEVAEARSLTPMLVQTFSLHMPIHFKKAKFMSCDGLKEKHYNTTIEDMVKQGALGVGEVGAWGIQKPKPGETPDISYSDVEYLPFMVLNETGHPIDRVDARALRLAVFAQPPDDRALTKLMEKMGVSAAKKKLKEFAERSVENAWLNIEACQEAVSYAKKLGVPLDFHNSPENPDQVIEFAQELKGLFHAAHCDCRGYTPSEAIKIAKAVKAAGGWVDIHVGDFFRARQSSPKKIVTLALLEEGLVDMLSTDCAGGFWDPMLRVLEYYIDQRAIDLPQAIALVTKNVIESTPNIAPNRGEVSEGKIADLVVLDRKSISRVKTVLIKGEVVVDEGRIVSQKP